MPTPASTVGEFVCKRELQNGNVIEVFREDFELVNGKMTTRYFMEISRPGSERQTIVYSTKSLGGWFEESAVGRVIIHTGDLFAFLETLILMSADCIKREQKD